MKNLLSALALPALLQLGLFSTPSLAETKRFITPDNYTWVYDHIPAKDSNPTVLLLHGFPASRKDWAIQIQNLTSAGYGIIAPDVLGYGDSSKPTDVRRYSSKQLSADVDAILGHEKLDSVVGVGHDFGSNILSASWVYHPKRFEKLAFVNVGYSAPGSFDLDAFNALGLQTVGYTPFGYWYFFNSPDAEDLMIKNIESAFHLVYPVQPSIWRDNLAAIGGARSWFNNNVTTRLPAYRTEADKAAWVKHYSSRNNLSASLNSYRSIMRGINTADEKNVTDAAKVITVPVLGVPGTMEAVALPMFLTAGTQPFAMGGYEEKPIASGHWTMLEKGPELGEILLDFVAKKKE